jgi:hypothetical protein
MSKEYKFVDAKKPLTIHVTEIDIKGATPGQVHNCVLTRAVRREHRCFDIVVFRTIAYIRKSENSIPIRYQVTESAKDLLFAFDASGRCRPMTVTLTPPRKGISSAYLRSPERKRAEKRSREKLKARDATTRERTRRAYTKPDPLTLLGVRNGSGGRPPGSRRMKV